MQAAAFLLRYHIQERHATVRTGAPNTRPHTSTQSLGVPTRRHLRLRHVWRALQRLHTFCEQLHAPLGNDLGTIRKVRRGFSALCTQLQLADLGFQLTDAHLTPLQRQARSFCLLRGSAGHLGGLYTGVNTGRATRPSQGGGAAYVAITV